MKLRIKVLGAIFRALKSSTCLDGRYEFVYDPACRDYDWLVVFDELPVACEELACPREHTILCTWVGSGWHPACFVS